jgi:putative addiction module CopG family antidote
MNVSLGKLTGWVKDQVKKGDFSTSSELVREAVRRMKEQEASEPDVMQRAMDEAEQGGFARMMPEDWQKLRRLAKSGITK